MQYLRESWNYLKGPENNTEEQRRQQVDKFLALYEDVRNAGRFSVPIKVCKRYDGRYILIDGNHRASIALKLGLPIFAKLIRPAEHLRNVSLVKGEFYGTGRLNMPCQSIFYGKKELVRGRRPDIYERIQKIFPADLYEQSVMDLGCNMGANCYTAVSLGARSAAGVDNSPDLITAAIRMNAFFAAPCRFIVHDLNAELTEVEPADTVFCFSITRHLKELTGLVRTLQAKTKKVLYFEGHPHSKLEDYPQILNNDIFPTIELIGYNRDNIDHPSKTRPFFRCEI